MERTIAEKVISSRSGMPSPAGEFVVAEVDLAFFHDGNRPLVSELLEDMELAVFRPGATKVVLDHAATCPNRVVANVQAALRLFAERWGVELFEVGEGVCHQVLGERGLIRPGSLVVGADSHTTTLGAFNALATGMGSSDVAAAVALGKTWLRVPETLRVEITGNLGQGVSAKDVALALVGKLGASGADYMALEFHGEGLDSLSLEGRMCVCNMATETGAKFAVMPCDGVLEEWFASQGIRVGQGVKPDPGANYKRVLSLDLTSLEPLVAAPGAVQNVHPVKEFQGIRVHEGVVGTCANGRLEDLRDVADVLRGRRLAVGRRLFVSPASRLVFRRAAEEGILATLVEAGAIIVPPGCGGCSGAGHVGIPADGEVVISAGTRNFPGRLGNPATEIYLASPRTVAASVVSGRICDPRDLT